MVDILGLLKRARDVAWHMEELGDTSEVNWTAHALDLDAAIALLERAEIVEGSGSTNPPDFIDCEPLEVPELRMRPATMIVWPEDET